MMTGLELFASKAFTLASIMVCDPAAPAVIEIHFENNEPIITHNLDHAQLGQFKSSTQISHGSNEVFTTGGITESNIVTSFDLSFGLVTNTFSRDTCLSLASVKIVVSYSPIVNIASNYAEGSCRYKTTWLHELQHVNTDIITLNEFVPYYQKAMEHSVAGFKTMGPLSPEQNERAQKEISARLQEVLTAATARMDQARMQRQQRIDTREEYLRLSNLCPGE